MCPDIVSYGQIDIHIRHLPGTGFTPHLMEYLTHHSRAGGTHRVPLAFEATGGIDWLYSIQSRFALGSCGGSFLSGLEKSQVGNSHYFGNGETIVYLGYLDVLRGNTGHFVSLLGSNLRGGYAG